MRLSNRLARLETALGLSRRGTASPAGRVVTEEERFAAADRYRAALEAGIAATIAGETVPVDDARTNPDIATLERWCVQHGQPPNGERERIAGEVLHGLADEELDAQDDACRKIEGYDPKWQSAVARSDAR